MTLFFFFCYILFCASSFTLLCNSLIFSLLFSLHCSLLCFIPCLPMSCRSLLFSTLLPCIFYSTVCLSFLICSRLLFLLCILLVVPWSRFSFFCSKHLFFVLPPYFYPIDVISSYPVTSPNSFREHLTRCNRSIYKLNKGNISRERRPQAQGNEVLNVVLF